MGVIFNLIFYNLVGTFFSIIAFWFGIPAKQNCLNADSKQRKGTLLAANFFLYRFLGLLLFAAATRTLDTERILHTWRNL